MIEVMKHNRQMLTFVILLGLTSVGALVWQHAASEWFMETSRDAGLVLTDLNITGLERTKEHSVLAVLDVDNGMPLLSVDLKSLQARVEALPWVKRAEVSRILPGGLAIHIIECEPYALLQTDGAVVLVDPDGMIITDRGLAEFEHLMLIVGSVNIEDLRYLDQLRGQAHTMMERVKSAVRVSGRRWDFIFDNGVRVKLPEDAAQTYNSLHAWEKFVRLNAEHRLLEREVNVIDMRTPDRLVMRVTPDGRRRMTGKEWAL